MHHQLDFNPQKATYVSSYWILCDCSWLGFLSLFNVGIVLESKLKVMCSKGNQQWGKITRGMYHYGNTERINSVLLILKESKGLKNEITNSYLDVLYDVISYATGPRQYLLREVVLAMDTCLPLTAQSPLRQRVLNLPNALWCGYLKHVPCNAIHIFNTPSSTLQLLTLQRHPV